MKKTYVLNCEPISRISLANFCRRSNSEPFDGILSAGNKKLDGHSCDMEFNFDVFVTCWNYERMSEFIGKTYESVEKIVSNWL